MKPIRHARQGSMLSLLAAAVLAACGGGADDGSATPSGAAREHALAAAASTPPTPQAAPFPTTGVVTTLALASPTALAKSFREGPEPNDYGTPASAALGGLVYSALVGGVMTAGTSVHAQDLLEEGPADASCFGLGVLYAHHDNGPDTAPARLPAGAVGLWQPEDGHGTPCVAAQMNSRLRSPTVNTTNGLLMAAQLVHVAQEAHLALPARGQTLTLVPQLDAYLKAGDPTSEVHTAAIAYGRDGTWTYAVNLSQGQGADARTVLYSLRHKPSGSDAQKYAGVLQYAVMRTGTDAALGCDDELASEPGQAPLYKVSTAGTLRYARSGAGPMELGAREGAYCGHAPAGSTSLGSLASLTPQGELDPAQALQGGTRHGIPGWRANFTRYGASEDRAASGGSYLLAWQPGTQDSHSRMLALRLGATLSGDGLTGAGHFLHGDRLNHRQPNPLGMICNWAGPGSLHLPQRRFQSQFLFWPRDGLRWTMDPIDQRTAYAPTNSCSASANMQFDLDGDGVLSPGEGSGLTAALDTPRANRSVAQELRSRGLQRPALF